MEKMSKLSTRQNDVLTFIKKYIAKNNYSPSVREIANGIHLNSPATVHVHIQKLIEKGYLQRNINNHNLLELMVPNEFELYESTAMNVPFIAKTTIKDYKKELKEPEEYFYLSQEMIPNGSEIFVVKVQDDNMYNTGIQKNDNIIVEKTTTISNEDIVVILTKDSKLVIGKYNKDKNNIILTPKNNLLSTITLKDTTILGKVISLYRVF